MSRISLRVLLTVAVALACAVPAVANAQEGPPPPPTNPSGHRVATVAQGVPTPTAFAFHRKDIFVAAFGAEDGSAPGGVYLLDNGVATHVNGTTEAPVTGIAWRQGALYAASGNQLIRYSGWTGSTFRKTKVLFDSNGTTAPFNGIAFDAWGTLYAGVSFTDDQYDHANDPAPFAQSVVRFAHDRHGKLGLRTVATGLRQPWQLTFIGWDPHPFVSDLAQDDREPAPPDQIVHVRPGQNYGFASCTWEPGSPCAGFNRPFRLLPQHSSPQGMAHIGKRLYVALFGGIGDSGPEAVSMSSTNPNSRIRPVLTGYVAPLVAVGAHHGRIYTGDLTGAIYSVRP
jgi:glucose/arabinose dehydrogenase